MLDSQAKQRNAHLSKHRSTDLYEVVAFGHKDLRMSDASMARELCISRQRVHQIRSKLGLSRVSRKEMPISGFRTFREDMTFYLNLDDAPPILVSLVGDSIKAQDIWNWFLSEFTENGAIQK